MRISDVVATYVHCTFCGRGVSEERAHRPAGGGVYHSQECYEFSLRYSAIRERLGAITP